ncbi:hypothetical protein SAMN05216251_108235 [Actinacidiphila alni]|uniref:Uncharacterized protein n=1 Tax=Actinacidiphila alni TaxID=380248 RepID=A0A1I2G481_9ACTN|nr:hypothetical protein [Actinacidiphila alni]SFF11807.1 hypothetical protein SAMN05216251_108235 [Actinacidiphila alni]
MSDPIIPTRVFPSAELPPRPPIADEAPPWRTPPAPPAPPAVPPPGDITITHRHVHEIRMPEPEPAPTRWDRAWALAQRLGRPWQLAAALALAFAPILPNRYSIAVTWAYCVQTTRAHQGQGFGYTLGIGALIAASWLVYRRATVPRLTALAVTALGALSAASLYDPILWITGVAR